jgi:SAM-dependent methyltransferase
MQHESLISSPEEAELIAVQNYWDEHIHDLEIATKPAGTPGFFWELDDYRFEKLSYLAEIVDFSAYRGKHLLEVGCGVGIDLVRFAQAGALVTGVDLAGVSIELARKNFEYQGLPAELLVMNGEDLQFHDNTFDVVYAHGVLQYTPRPKRMIAELHRVLKPGGEAVLMVYNKYSWLNALSKFMNVELEHADAPALRKYSIGEFKDLLGIFPEARIVPERFPVETRLHHGRKAYLYNSIFVRSFRILPRSIVRPLGWHLMAFARK